MDEHILTQFQIMAKQASEDVTRALEALDAFQQSEDNDNSTYEEILKQVVQLALSSQRLLHATIANAPYTLGKAELKMLEDHERASQTYYRAITQKWKRVEKGWQTTDGTIVDDFGNRVRIV